MEAYEEAIKKHKTHFYGEEIDWTDGKEVLVSQFLWEETENGFDFWSHKYASWFRIYETFNIWNYEITSKL